MGEVKVRWKPTLTFDSGSERSRRLRGRDRGLVLRDHVRLRRSDGAVQLVVRAVGEPVAPQLGAQAAVGSGAGARAGGARSARALARGRDARAHLRGGRRVCSGWQR